MIQHTELIRCKTKYLNLKQKLNCKIIEFMWQNEKTVICNTLNKLKINFLYGRCYGYRKRSHLASAENLNTYFCQKCDSEIYDWANPAVKKSVLTFLSIGQTLYFLYLILMFLTRLCVISLCSLFHIAIFLKLHLYLNIY